jgi:SRSO17 transposase
MKHHHHTTLVEPETTIHDVLRWAREVQQLHARIAPRFARPEPRCRALLYLQAILSDLPRKNGWQIAEHAREARPDGMQRLLSQAVWDADRVRDDLRGYILEHLGDPEAILVIDETSFPKRGKKSVGVQVQYCGTTGQCENCQVGVFLSYLGSQGHTLLDRELYVPMQWFDDQERCREAGIPETTRFQTKCELAGTMVERVLQAKIPIRWVVADCVYGSNARLRAHLHAYQCSYVLAVHSTEPVELQTPTGRMRMTVAEAEARFIQPQQWQRLSMGEGTRMTTLVRLGLFASLAPLRRGWTPLLAHAASSHQAERERLLPRLCPRRDHACRNGPGHRRPLVHRRGFQNEQRQWHGSV